MFSLLVSLEGFGAQGQDSKFQASVAMSGSNSWAGRHLECYLSLALHPVVRTVSLQDRHWNRAVGHSPSLFQAPLTATDTAILSGNLSTQNGNGGGSINIALRRVTSAKGWGEVRGQYPACSGLPGLAAHCVFSVGNFSPVSPLICYLLWKVEVFSSNNLALCI